MRPLRIQTRRKWKMVDRYPVNHPVEGVRSTISTGDIIINRPRMKTIIAEEVNILIPRSKKPHYEALKPPKTEPTPPPTHTSQQTSNESEKKGLGWKFWVGIALAGIAAAGVGTYMFKNK